MIVDVQCHIFPKSFIAELSSPKSQLRVMPPDATGRRVIIDSRTNDEVTFFVDNSCYVDTDAHVRDMQHFKIDKQVLSLPTPSVDKISDPDVAFRISMLINNEISGMVRKYPDKFLGFATIPMNDPTLATREIRRVVTDLGFKGVVISSNTQGKFYDGEEYDSVFETLERLRVPVFVHPTEPVTGKQIGQDYKLTLIFGWPFDTTLSVSRLVFSGLLEKYPDLKIIAAHGGGMIPFFAGRIEMLARVAAGGGKMISVERPADAFKKLYYDAAFFNSDSLELLAKFAGPEHILYASDYPFGQNLGKNCYEQSIAMMENARLDSVAKDKIYGTNILSLLNVH
ncbi:MAG: amidohydrolase [Nitrososphaerota archaeon]|nr:amidohydrolase [Nitrososphaerota archaeon]